MRLIIRAAMALVAVAAFVLSFQTLTELARLAGYGGLSFLYPVTLDLGTVSSCAAWMATRSRQAFHMTWSLLSASILMNGVEHWLSATGQRPAWWLVTVISMAPPAILGVVTHLAVGLGGPDRLERRVHEPAGPVTSPGGVMQVTAEPGELLASDTLDDLLAQGAGRRRIAAELGVSEHEARKLLAERNGHGR